MKLLAHDFQYAEKIARKQTLRKMKLLISLHYEIKRAFVLKYAKVNLKIALHYDNCRELHLLRACIQTSAIG